MKQSVILFLVFSLTFGSSFAEKILVIRFESPNFAAVLQGLKGELKNDFQVVDFVMTEGTSYETFHQKVFAEHPDLLVLMDNKPIRFAMKLSTDSDPWAQQLKSVATMGLNLRKMLQGAPNICGVEYEVPFLSIITGFRYTSGKPVNNVLLFFRGSEHSDLIAAAKTQLEKEKINLVAKDVEANGVGRLDIRAFLRRHLRQEVRSGRYDAVLVPTDNGMLNEDTFGKFWSPLAKSSKVPFLAGVEEFTPRALDFCAWAVYPNHRDLGGQVAQMVFAILADGESPKDLGVEYILSTRKALNLRKMRKLGILVDHQKLEAVDAVK